MVRNGARRLVAVLVSTAVLALAACSTTVAARVPAPTTPPDPAALIQELSTRILSVGPYRDPTSEERRAAREAVRTLVAEPRDPVRAAAIFEQLGFRTIEGLDPATQRPFLLSIADPTTERSWGAVLADTSAPADVLIEVPHPGSDVFTEVLGVESFRSRPGSVLLMAGAHRLAADRLGDVAHNDNSLFHAMATQLAEAGLTEVQLHGFADATLPGADVAVATGRDTAGRTASRIGATLAADGFTVCLAWEHSCGRLEGTTNVQGQAAADNSTVFVHLEVSWTVRSDEERRRMFVDSLVGAL